MITNIEEVIIRIISILDHCNWFVHGPLDFVILNLLYDVISYRCHGIDSIINVLLKAVIMDCFQSKLDIRLVKIVKVDVFCVHQILDVGF
jgi:hypothetical protein